MFCPYHMQTNCLYYIQTRTLCLYEVMAIFLHVACTNHFRLYQVWKTLFLYIPDIDYVSTYHIKTFYFCCIYKNFFPYDIQTSIIYVVQTNCFYHVYTNITLSILHIYNLSIYHILKRLVCIMYRKNVHIQYRHRYFCLHLVYTICLYHIHTKVSLYILHMDILSINDVDKISQCIVHTKNISLILIINITYIYLCSI